MISDELLTEANDIFMNAQKSEFIQDSLSKLKIIYFKYLCRYTFTIFNSSFIYIQKRIPYDSDTSSGVKNPINILAENI